MSRATLILNSQAIRDKACDWVRKAPDETRVTFARTKRTLPQNDRMWAMLTEVAEQHQHMGRTYKPDVWKCIFMDAALGTKSNYVPSLDGETVVLLGFHSSDLSKDEMGELMDFIEVWCVDNGVTLSHVEGTS